MSFIVIEGLDGSGKSTQLKLLKEYLDKQNVKFKYLHFPRVETGIFGDLVARFLRGDLGKIDQVDPYLVSLIYAGDRDNAKQTINEWINKDYLVIVDRYVYSNMAFQGAKIPELEKKVELRTWLNHLEYEYYKIPKPELSLFLDVPFSFTTNSLTKQRTGEDRDYLQGKQDIHEADLSFQEKVRQEYLALLKEDDTFKQVICYDTKENAMLPPNEIFNTIITTLKINNIIK